ncbi:MAG: hypothetical protein KAI79_09850 [Bacteroidales bacterium]|nr:hypothetical protein [Bacteroidales bacterium]
MTITIEDAPAVRHITIDIDFDGDETTTTIQQDTRTDEEKYPYTHGKKGVPDAMTTTPIKKPQTDIELDLDTDFKQQTTEIIEKPVIEEVERDASISTDMMEATY